MNGSEGFAEGHSTRGPIDRPALITIRDLFNDEEPLTRAALDDFLDPTRLEIHLNDGVAAAETARIDSQWTTRDDYTFHYTDTAGIDVRWDRHPHDGDYVHADGPEHFHPPPDASSAPEAVETSCIEQFLESLVARAVLTLWRTAYHAGSVVHLNAGSNPP